MSLLTARMKLYVFFLKLTKCNIYCILPRSKTIHGIAYLGVVATLAFSRRVWQHQCRLCMGHGPADLGVWYARFWSGCPEPTYPIRGAQNKCLSTDHSRNFVGLSAYVYQTFGTQKSTALFIKFFCALAFYKKVIKATTLKSAQIKKIKSLY